MERSRVMGLGYIGLPTASLLATKGALTISGLKGKTVIDASGLIR